MKTWKDGERKVAKLLEEWWGVKFYRSPESGAMATLRSNSLPKSMIRNSIGDIICDQLDTTLDCSCGFPFTVEVKCYKQIPLYSLLTKPSDESVPLLEQFWIQATDQATKAERQPLLIFKEDRKPFFCAVSQDLFYKISSVIPTKTEDIISNTLFFKDMAIMQWNKFVEYFPREFVEMAVNAHNMVTPNIAPEPKCEALV